MHVKYNYNAGGQTKTSEYDLSITPKRSDGSIWNIEYANLSLIITPPSGGTITTPPALSTTVPASALFNLVYKGFELPNGWSIAVHGETKAFGKPWCSKVITDAKMPVPHINIVIFERDPKPPWKNIEKQNFHIWNETQDGETCFMVYENKSDLCQRYCTGWKDLIKGLPYAVPVADAVLEEVATYTATSLPAIAAAATAGYITSTLLLIIGLYAIYKIFLIAVCPGTAGATCAVAVVT